MNVPHFSSDSSVSLTGLCSMGSSESVELVLSIYWTFCALVIVLRSLGWSSVSQTDLLLQMEDS